MTATPPAATVHGCVSVPVTLADGRTTTARVYTFDGLVDGRDHIALALGPYPMAFVDDPSAHAPLVRLHSECLTGDVFGSQRYHERRSSGRKGASPGLVVRGSVRLVAGLLTRLEPDQELGVERIALDRWQQLRAALERRQEARRQQRRFRKDPAAYLGQLEDRFLKSGLPA